MVVGRFRDDLFARLNLWTFNLPGLAERREDIAPNLEYELDRYAEREGARVTFNKEARERYLAFAESSTAPWPGNFRDLASSITRMATLCPTGRIDVASTEAEIARLRGMWSGQDPGSAQREQFLDAEMLSAIDPFDRVQLAFVLETAATPDHGRRLAGSCSHRPAHFANRRTTQTGCAKISHALVWAGAISVDSRRGLFEEKIGYATASSPIVT